MKVINLFLFEATQKYIIFCDLDGVLTDWDGAVEKLGHGTIDDIKKKHGEDFVWKLIIKAGIHFWSDMSWTKDGKQLWDYIKRYRPTILSAPIAAQSSKIGKKIWVKKNLGQVKLILESSKKKHLHATPNAILIDDRPDNIARWKQAGGIGILHTDAVSTIEKLKELL